MASFQVPDQRLGVSRDEFIFQGHNGLSAPGVTLACTSPEELSVDATGFITLGGHDVQPSHLRNPASQLDVRAPPRHIGGHGNLSRLTSLGNDLGLLAVTNGIEDLVVQMAFFQ